MNRPPADFDLNDLPEARAVRKRGWSVQFIWLIPIVAALIGGWLVVKGIMDKGPTITITFKTAEGLEAGKTKVKYKSVDIGDVTHISLAGKGKDVEVTVELDKRAESRLVEDTKFWVVRPRIAGGMVSGLGTLFSGSYIGVDPGTSEIKRREFVGLEVAPLITGDVPGRQFILRAENLGSLQAGSPIFFRQEAVGSVVAHELNEDGQGVTFKIFVNSPYDQYVTPSTRFWNASGVDISLDATGIKVDTQSLASILIGGVAFETLPGATKESPAEENREFRLSTTRSEAMKRADTISHPAIMYFDQSIRGLSIGAPVDFRGIVIGEVKSMGVEFNEAESKFRFPVTLELYPSRILSLMKNALRDGEINPTDLVSRRARWDRMVAAGFRGELKTGNLLTGQLYIAIDFHPNAPKAEIDWTGPGPVLPTISGGFQELQETISNIAKKIEKMPLEEIGTDLRQSIVTLNRTLNSADKMVKRLDADVTPTAKSALEEARKTLQTVEKTLAIDSPVQHETQETLRELNRTMQSLRLLGEYLERHPEALVRGKKEGQQ
ncbi:MAG: intermembrane transport protein PqiB [Nitrospiraceae bacterium]